MSLSDVIRNIAKTVTNKDELKERAKDLPLLVTQTALSAAGQAMLLVDRVKNSIRGQGEKEEQNSSPAADQLAAPAVQDEEKPARKEPVIFAPRPGSAEPNGTGTGKPDPVIFAPAGKTEPATAEPAEPAEAKTTEAKAAQAPVAPAKPETAEPTTEPTAGPVAETAAETAADTTAETTAGPVAETGPAATEEAAAKPAVADEAGAVEKPAAAAKAAPKPRATRAKPKADDKPAARKPAAKKPATRKSAAKEPAAATEPAATEPAATEPAATEPAATEPAATEPAAAAEPGAAGATDLAEPLPGYAELTVASLRARMRGKTAEQISAFLAYERATTGRAEVIRMFENRLAKLQAGE
nr:hypothetical protein [Nonomuraea mesophila]